MTRKDLEGRLPIVYNGKSVEEWYTLYCQQALKNNELQQRIAKMEAAARLEKAMQKLGNGETYMRVTYEIPPTRAIKWQDFEEQALSDEGVYACLARTYPGWAIKKLERNLPIKGDSDGERGRWLL